MSIIGNYLLNESRLNESDFLCHKEIPWTGARVQRVTTLVILMVMSLFGNSVIIIVIATSKTHKSLNRVNIFILNLAVGDFLIGIITICSELILEISGEWILGNFGCKTLMPAQILTLSLTTYILVAMSKDRYQAICRPLDFNPSASRARKSVLVAWVAAFLSALPYMFIFVQVKAGIHEDGSDCFSCRSEGYTASWQRKLNFIWLTLSVFIFPALWIAFCYFSLAKVVWQQAMRQQTGDGLRKTCGGRLIPRTKMKTLKMSLSIVITFIVCWTPYFVVYNLQIFSNYELEIPESIVVFADTLALTNSVVNPVIYSCYNMKIKQGITEACCLRFEKSSSQRLFEPSASTSSTIRLNIRKTYCRSYAQHHHSQETALNFDKSNQHIFKKRSQLVYGLRLQKRSQLDATMRKKKQGPTNGLTEFQRHTSENVQALLNF